MPKNSLGVMDISNGQVAKIEKVKRFQLPEEGSGFIAYLLEPKPEARPEAKKPEASPPSAEKKPEQNQARPKGKKKEYGSDLVLRNLADGSERIFADVLEFAFSDDAKSLVYAVSSKQEETNGVFAVTPGSAAAPTGLLSGKGQYAKLTWDEDATQLAFLSDRDDPDAKCVGRCGSAVSRRRDHEQVRPGLEVRGVDIELHESVGLGRQLADGADLEYGTVGMNAREGDAVGSRRRFGTHTEFDRARFRRQLYYGVVRG